MSGVKPTKCPVCKKQVPPGTALASSALFGSYEILVVGFHVGRNGKPCSGIGQRGGK